MALTLRLTKMGLSGIGRLYDVDHSTVHHARQVMRPILDATGLTEVIAFIFAPPVLRQFQRISLFPAQAASRSNPAFDFVGKLAASRK
jgi:hypothetical protein